MSSRLQLSAKKTERAIPAFSMSYTLFFHILAKERKTSSFLSSLCALFPQKRGGVPSFTNCASEWPDSLTPSSSYSCKIPFAQPLSFDTHTKSPALGVPLFSLRPYFFP